MNKTSPPAVLSAAAAAVSAVKCFLPVAFGVREGEKAIETCGLAPETPGTPEAALYSDFLRPRDWLSIGENLA